MAEYSAIAEQIVNPGESVIFTETVVPCYRGLVRHREGSGNFLLSGWVPASFGRCCCKRFDRSAMYDVFVGANISIPTGGTVGEISVALAIDGSTEAESVMTVTPAAVENEFNVARSTSIPIFSNCCQTVTLRNISDQPIAVSGANIKFTRTGLNS